MGTRSLTQASTTHPSEAFAAAGVLQRSRIHEEAEETVEAKDSGSQIPAAERFNRGSGFKQNFSRVPLRSAGMTAGLPVVQAKLTVGQASDQYEQEADRVANQVMAMPGPGHIRHTPSIQHLNPKLGAQRQMSDLDEDEDEKLVQAKGNGSRVAPAEVGAIAGISEGLQISRGGGQPLSPSVRKFMEPRFNNDFSQVRVHTDGAANLQAQKLNAQAFTHKQDIFFGARHYTPESYAGRQLLAHELTHVVQQSGGGARLGSVVQLRTQPNALQRRQLPNATQLPITTPLIVEETTEEDSSFTAPERVTPTPADRSDTDSDIDNSTTDDTQSVAPAEAGSTAAPSAPSVPDEAGHNDIEPLMPKPPSTLSPAARGRLAHSQAQASQAAATSADLPTAETNTAAARGAVEEPQQETEARAEGDLVAALGERPEPSLEIEALCERIRAVIRSKRPPDEDALIKADPQEAAREAGNQLNQSIEGNVGQVGGSYDQLNEPQTGTPQQLPKEIETPPEQVNTPEIGASAATPDPVPAQAVSLDGDVAASAARIDAAGMNTEPARLAAEGDLEGPIATAQATQGELSETAQRDPAEVLAQQQQALSSASGDMAALQERALAALMASRAGTVTGVSGQQSAMIGSEEQMRAQIGIQAQQTFTAAQKQVNTLLAPLQRNAMNKWERGKTVLTTQFKQRLADVERWVEEEYSGVIGSIIEYFAGLPDWAVRGYERAEKEFGDGVCALIHEISTEVNSIVATCEQLIDTARQEIEKLFSSDLPEELKEWAEGEKARFGAQLDGLQNRVTKTRDGLNRDLANRAAQSVQEVREEIHALREAAKSLLGRVSSAVDEFLDDPAKFVINGLLKLLSIATSTFWRVVDRISQAIDSIADDPLGFGRNLLEAVGQGFQRFFDHVADHLLGGFLDWLFSGLGAIGLQVPQDFSLKSVIGFFLDLMGFTWARIRRMLAKHIGEENIALIEKAFELISELIEKGIDGIVEMIEPFLNLQSMLDQVIASAVDFIKDVITTQVSVRILALFNPVGAILQAVEAIYKVLKWIFENAARIFSLVETVTGGITQIIAGNVGGMATAIELALARLLVPVIDFVASFAGLSDLPDKVADTIKGFQEWIGGIIERVIDALAERAKALLRSLKIGSDSDEADMNGVDPSDHAAFARAAAEMLKAVPFTGHDSPIAAAKAFAAEKEPTLSAQLEEGIGLRFVFTDDPNELADGDLDFSVVIAPNTTTHEDKVELEVNGEIVTVWIVDDKRIRLSLDPDDPQFDALIAREASPERVLSDVMKLDLDIDRRTADAFIEELNSLGMLRTDRARPLLISFAQVGPGSPLDYLQENLRLGRSSRAARQVPTGRERQLLVDQGTTAEGEQRETLSSYASVFWESSVGQFVSRQVQRDPSQGGSTAIEFVFNGEGQPRVRNLGIVRVGDDGAIEEIVEITNEIESVEAFVSLMERSRWTVRLG
ncbi:MAG: DUF4157 domain-containing protein [Phormidesmis sp.]